MKLINDFADRFEKSTLNIIYKIRKLFCPKSVEKTTKIIEKLTEDYQKLINEYELIKQGKSKLSKQDRDAVTVRVAHLVTKGHIKINTDMNSQNQNNSSQSQNQNEFNDDQQKMLDSLDRNGRRQVLRAIKGKKKYGYK